MQVNIKKLHPDAVIPTYAHDTDAGMDLTAVSFTYPNPDEHVITYHTGLSIEIPKGYVGLIFPRSSIYKQDLILNNSVGVIDSGYRGEIMAKFVILKGKDSKLYKPGDRIAQLIILPYPKIEFNEVNELSDTDRGENGYGSTGN